MKGGSVLLVVLALLLAAPTGIAPPANGSASGGGAPGANAGLERACTVANSPQPCSHLGVVTDLNVTTGENDHYNGTWTVDQTITVHTGGVLTLEEATFRFTSASGGIVVQPGGVLRIYDSVLEPRDGGAMYVLDLQPASSFTLNESTVRGGNGVKLATSDADVSGNLLTEIPLALHLLDVVEVTIHHNHFLNNTVSVNQTGGITTLDSNFFQGGETCVRDWLADPTIINNVFRGCHVGIWHEQSNSRFALNDMEDEAHEPGTGILVQDTMSPYIEDNLIRNYGTGILVINATAYIRNNTISNNVLDGVRVMGNTQIMDITGNVITGNGDDGIHLVDAQGVETLNNTIGGNGGAGVRVESSLRIQLAGDDVYGNGQHGFILSDSDVGATGVRALGNALNGMYFVGGGDYDVTNANASSNGYDGFRVATTAGASVFLTAPVAIGNLANGLRGMNGTTADNGWWEANGGAGVENVDADFVLSSTCSYWGSASGPTHVDNPSGTGDEVVGNVDYTPFRSSPAATSCSPVLLVPEGDYVG